MKTLIFSLMFFAYSIFGAGTAYACSCLPPQNAAKELERSSAVFSGRVIEIKRYPEPGNIFGAVEAVFAVRSVWKGVETTRVSVFTSSNSAACGYGFSKNRTYLVYAYAGEDGTLQTSICSRTAKVKDAVEDLKQLGPGKDPQVFESLIPEPQGKFHGGGARK